MTQKVLIHLTYSGTTSIIQLGCDTLNTHSAEVRRTFSFAVESNMVSGSPKKTVLITGCSAGGIGDALAQSFHGKGHRVFATARDLSKIEHLKEMGMTILPLDVVSTLSVNEALKAVIVGTGGSLDILVNNSGIGRKSFCARPFSRLRSKIVPWDRLSLTHLHEAGYWTPILDADLDYARRLFETNFFGRVAVTQAFSELLIKSNGTIINIGSISGLNPTPWTGIYNASCAAVNLWSDTLRLEMEPFGVKVILVGLCE